jgi:hypothetical protein
VSRASGASGERVGLVVSLLLALLAFADARCTALETQARYETKAASAATCWEEFAP